jgi:preprotein translocase subunit SecG
MFEKLSQKQKMSVDSSTCLNSFITIFLLVLFFAFIITGLILDDSTNEDQNIEELENSNN